MRKLISLSFISFFSIAIYSQKIKGVVTDINGKLLPFASVFIKENNKGTNANTEGKYSLKLEPGQYTLVCQYVGYKKDERKISLSKDEDIEINFVLALQEMTLDEVIVKNGEDPAYQIIRNTIQKKTITKVSWRGFNVKCIRKGRCG